MTDPLRENVEKVHPDTRNDQQKHGKEDTKDCQDRSQVIALLRIAVDYSENPICQLDSFEDLAQAVQVHGGECRFVDWSDTGDSGVDLA